MRAAEDLFKIIRCRPKESPKRFIFTRSRPRPWTVVLFHVLRQSYLSSGCMCSDKPSWSQLNPKDDGFIYIHLRRNMFHLLLVPSQFNLVGEVEGVPFQSIYANVSHVVEVPGQSCKISVLLSINSSFSFYWHWNKYRPQRVQIVVSD